MNPEIKAKWVAALRSGEYKQARGKLRSGEQFCCLGVLCDLHRKEVSGWQWEKGHYGGYDSILPASVQNWAGIKDFEAPHDPQINGRCVSAYNDEGYDFPEIADLIEKHL